jgi:hypothetical protein
MDDELEASAQRRLDSSLIDFAIALRCVAVADLEQCARNVDGNEQRGAGHELAIIQISGMDARRRAAHAPRSGRRRNAHAAEERTQGNHDARREHRRHPFAVERKDRGVVGAGPTVVAQKSAAAVVAVGDRQIDREDPHFERIAGLGPFDVDRPGQNVPARSLVGDGIQLCLWQRTRRSCERRAADVRSPGRAGTLASDGDVT